MATLDCSQCNRSLVKESFSKSQAKQGAKRRCKACIEGGQPVAAAEDVPSQAAAASELPRELAPELPQGIQTVNAATEEPAAKQEEVRSKAAADMDAEDMKAKAKAKAQAEEPKAEEEKNKKDAARKQQEEQEQEALLAEIKRKEAQASAELAAAKEASEKAEVEKAAARERQEQQEQERLRTEAEERAAKAEAEAEAERQSLEEREELKRRCDEDARVSEEAARHAVASQQPRGNVELEERTSATVEAKEEKALALLARGSGPADGEAAVAPESIELGLAHIQDAAANTPGSGAPQGVPQMEGAPAIGQMPTVRSERQRKASAKPSFGMQLSLVFKKMNQKMRCT